jgi:hypothetical protein
MFSWTLASGRSLADEQQVFQRLLAVDSLSGQSSLWLGKARAHFPLAQGCDADTCLAGDSTDIKQLAFFENNSGSTFLSMYTLYLS